MNIHTLIRILRYDDPQTPICVRHNDKDVPLMLSDVWLWHDTDNKVVLTESTYEGDVQIENLNGHTQPLDVEWIHTKYDKPTNRVNKRRIVRGT